MDHPHAKPEGRPLHEFSNSLVPTKETRGGALCREYTSLVAHWTLDLKTFPELKSGGCIPLPHVKGLALDIHI